MKVIKIAILVVVIVGVAIFIFWFQYQKRSNITSLTKNNNLGVMSETEKMEDQVIGYLGKSVPEIEMFRQEIEKESKGQVRLIMRFDGVPDKNSNDEYHDYYCVYVGEEHSDHTVRWNTFYVKSDLTKILVEDVISGDNVSLEKWRKNKN
jgi:hypothetical protein